MLQTRTLKGILGLAGMIILCLVVYTSLVVMLTPISGPAWWWGVTAATVTSVAVLWTGGARIRRGTGGDLKSRLIWSDDTPIIAGMEVRHSLWPILGTVFIVVPFFWILAAPFWGLKAIADWFLDHWWDQ